MELISSLNDHSPKPRTGRSLTSLDTGSHGFSLIELMAVISVTALLTASVLPAVHNLIASNGRNGTLNILMNSFEQARLAALSSGQTVYIAFVPQDASAPSGAPAHLVIFREVTDEEREAEPEARYVVLKNWTPLLPSVVLASTAGTLIGPDATSAPFPGLNERTGFRFDRETFPYLSFNSSGAISQPAGDALRLALAENVSSARKPAEPWGGLRFSRSTGRAWVESATSP